MAEQWLTCNDLAQRWGVSVETVRRWINQGDLRATLIGRYRVRPEWADEFERSRESSPEPEPAA